MHVSLSYALGYHPILALYSLLASNWSSIKIWGGGEHTLMHPATNHSFHLKSGGESTRMLRLILSALHLENGL